MAKPSTPSKPGPAKQGSAKQGQAKQGRAAMPTAGKAAPRAAPKATPQAAPSPAPAPAKCFTSPGIDLSHIAPGFKRADIEFHSLDHSGASYEGRIFLNNPRADAKTPRTPSQGYAGSFHVFGHGGCWGDPGHCEILPRRPYDPRPAHPLTPGRKTVIATAAVQRALKQGHQLTVTVVPVVRDAPKRVDAENVLHFERLKIVTYS
jgi:tyrosinase